MVEDAWSRCLRRTRESGDQWKPLPVLLIIEEAGSFDPEELRRLSQLSQPGAIIRTRRAEFVTGLKVLGGMQDWAERWGGKRGLVPVGFEPCQGENRTPRHLGSDG